MVSIPFCISNLQLNMNKLYSNFMRHKFGRCIFFAHSLFLLLLLGTWYLIWRKQIFLSFDFENHDPPINKRERRTKNTKIESPRIKKAMQMKKRKKRTSVLYWFFGWIELVFCLQWIYSNDSEKKKKEMKAKFTPRENHTATQRHNDKYYWSERRGKKN